MILAYVIIVIIATILGATAGLGGGVIIKPFFDLMGIHSVATIGVYSAIAVFTMAIVSIYKQIRNKANFDLSTVLYISFGSVIGGLGGETLFQAVNNQFSDYIGPIQSICLSMMLLFLLIYSLNKEKIKTYHLKNKIIIIFIGIALGVVSVFLGIGGGPLNLAVLIYFFSYDTKQASILSIVTIFFSQLSKLMKIALTTGFAIYDLSVIPYIIVASIIGGYIGSVLNKRFTNKQIDIMYNCVLLFLIVLSLYNFMMAL